MPPKKKDIVCDICETEISKYRCPICQCRYCSLNCYKEHKSDEKCKPNTEEVEVQNFVDQLQASTRQPGSLDYGDESEDYVPLRQLKQLKNSEDLSKLLSNPHLRTYLSKLDTSRRPAEDMARAMREPLFVEFANECLRVLHGDQEGTDE